MVETAAAGSRMQQTETAVATAVTVPVARFQEVHATLERSKNGVGVEDHLKKSADSLARAMLLRSEAEKIARGEGVSPSRGDRSMRSEEEGGVMFHDLPTIAGDNLFEETQRWLKTSNPFDARKSEATKNKVDDRKGGGGGQSPALSGTRMWQSEAKCDIRPVGIALSRAQAPTCSCK